MAGIDRLAAGARIWGTVCAGDGQQVEVAGLGPFARVGDWLMLEGRPGREPCAEIVRLERDGATAMLLRPGDGVGVGGRAWLTRAPLPRPSVEWLGRIVDYRGCSLEGEALTEGHEPAPLRRAPPRAERRRGFGPRLETGLAALDAALPFCRGQRLGVFAGSGVGKSMLLGHLARTLPVDVTVVALIGERGREVSSFVRETLGPEALSRAVVVAATSDQSALMQRRAAYLAMATAEHFRDRGAHVGLLFDSVTRFADAHRAVALATGEMPALRAYPPSTASEIAALCERAGPGEAADGESDTRAQGDITAVFTVLVAGSDMDEPVADILRGVLDGHLVLDRAIAERGRFPAIDLRQSVSRAAPAAWSAEETRLSAELRRRIAAYEDALPMLRSGLYAAGSDPALDLAVASFPSLDAFLAERRAQPEPHWAEALLRERLGEEPLTATPLQPGREEVLAGPRSEAGALE